MIANATPREISKKSQEAVIDFQYQAYSLMMQQYNIREQMRQVDLAYIRENDLTIENQRAKRANQWGDANRYQNITVPVVMPQVETSVTYQASVFLTGTPLFGCVADPKYIDAATQYETIMDENATRGAWKQQLMMMFRDGFKYNLSCAEVCWDRKITFTPETDLTFDGGAQGKPKEVVWAGNCIRRMDMYNTFFDTRVHPTQIYKEGEFAGYTRLMGRVALKKYIQELPDRMVSNISEAFESGFGGWGSGATNGGVMAYYIPYVNPNALVNKNQYATTDWMQWSGLANSSTGSKGIKYANLYEVTVMYARILPSDFRIISPGSNTAQVWKFIIINHQVVIYAERQTNAHDFIPMLFSQPNEDGLAYQTKSVADNVIPIQSVSSALMNSVIAARRRAVGDRVLYDPSRITEANINSDNPSAKIPVRPAAYGKDLKEAVYQFPFRDDQSQIALGEIANLGNMADYIVGHNKAQQGQFVKGNKTRHEYEDVMSHASGRDQLCSILLEDQFFSPLKVILKSNMMQYQAGTTLYNRANEQMVKIDPVQLRQAIVEFKISDGLVPSDKLINADVASVALQQIGSSPVLAAKYNIGQLFSYILKTQGGDSIGDFEKSQEQLTYEQAMQQWQSQQQVMLEMMKSLAPIAAKETPLVEIFKMVQQASPPQPTPEQFGYNPNPQAAQKSTTNPGV